VKKIKFVPEPKPQKTTEEMTDGHEPGKADASQQPAEQSDNPFL